MKIKKTVTQQVETEIELPYFFTHDTWFYGLFTKDIAFRVSPDNYTAVVKSKADTFAAEAGKGEQITKKEFYQQYYKALAGITVPEFGETFEDAAEEAERFTNWMEGEAERQLENSQS